MRKRSIYGSIALTLFLGLVVVVGVYAYRRSTQQRALVDIVAQLDQADPGWRLEDIEKARPDVPATEDSAPLILKLHSRLPARWLVEDPASHWRDLPPNEPLPPQEAAFFGPRMFKMETLLPEVRKLADYPRGRFVITYTPDMISTLLPDVHRVREMADLLRQDACWQAHQGAIDVALVSCRAGINAARSLDDEPLLISQLVRTRSLHQAVAGLQRTLAAGEPAASALPVVQQALLDADKSEMIVVGLRGERAGMHRLCSNVANGTVSMQKLAIVLAVSGIPGGGPTFKDQAEALLVSLSLPASHPWMLRHFTECIDASRLPAAEQDKRVKQLQQAPAEAPLFAKLITPAWQKCHAAFRRQHAHTRCAATAVAVERYRQRHGRWPDDLAALTPEFLAAVPLDPFTDEPVKYRMTADGVVVFSVGADKSHRGDMRDQPQPVDPGTTAGWAEAEQLEFRLWNPEARSR